MRIMIILAVAACLAGCNPYMAAVTAVSQTYGATTDERSIGTQISDDELEAKIKTALVESPVSGTSGISVYVRQGVVVLTGVVPRGSDAGRAAVRIAQNTSGVVQVETYFVDSQPSSVDDLEIEGKVKAAFVEDSKLLEGRVDVAVYGGHVVLIGVAGSEAAIQRYIDDARSVPGVVSVRNYIQLPSA